MDQSTLTPTSPKARLVNRRGSIRFFHASTSTQLPTLFAATAVPAFSRSPTSTRSVSIEAQTIRIWHENLRATSHQTPTPLSSLTLDEHIHGGLRLEIGGRLVPYLGYFGPDDVCFGTWLEELGRVARAFGASPDGRHTFDEGEQGQPAYLFERIGDHAYFSITDSEFSGGVADPDWQRIQFSPHEFLSEHDRFRQSFVELLRAEAPHIADDWLRRHAQIAP